MAIYHLTVNIIGRTSGRSAVAAIAYRWGGKIKNERDGITHDYTNRKASYRSGENDFINRNDILYSEIILPTNAPKEFADRYILWNTVEKSEKRYDAQTAREVEIALPIELSEEQQIKIVQDYVRENFVKYGMIADFSIHSGHKHTKKNEHKDEPIKPDNPHVHIMLTMREVSEKGFGKKNRDWNKPEYLQKWRENWANIVNREFERLGIDERIDHRTLEAQGIDREPTIHVGHNEERAQKNQEIIKRNIEKGLKIYSEKNREIQKLEYLAKEMSARALQVHNQYGREHFKRLYGVEPEYANAEIARNKAQAERLRRELGEWDKYNLFEKEKALDYAEIQRQKDDRRRRIYERTR